MSLNTDSIDWGRLEDAYGSASEVPDLLNRLSKAKDSRLDKVIEELYSRVLHQGTIYSASPPTARALIALLPDATAGLRACCYEMLRDFAEAARQAIADGRAIPCQSGGDPKDGEAIREAIVESWSRFVTGLNDPDPGVRACAAELLTAFANSDPGAVRRVREHYFAETSATVREAMLTGLTRTSQLQEDWHDFLGMSLAHEKGAAGQFGIRYAQIRELRTAVDDAAVDSFIGAFAAACADVERETPMEARFFEALGWLGAEREVPALLRGLELVPQEGPVREIAENLLRKAFDDRRTGWGQTAYSRINTDGTKFPQPSLLKMLFRTFGTLLLLKLSPGLMRRRMAKLAAEKPKGIAQIDYWGLDGPSPELPEKLNAMQRRVLSALASKDALWQFRTNLWQLFELPSEANALREWIAARS